MAEMSIADQLVHTTVRIECQDAAGQASSGTGFFFNFCQGSDGQHVPALITNKHVIKDAQIGVFHLNTTGDNGDPAHGEHVPVPIADFEKGWIPHPEADVDLAAFPLAPIFEWVFQTQGKRAYLKSVNREFMALADDLNELSAVEDIVMVGYPNGLWDARNNFPIVRRGITATPPYVDFEGRKEFMIDCACFPGSSGSPVFLYNIGSYANKGGGVSLGGRVKFLGVLWGGPQHTAQGAIRVVPIPTRDEPVAFSRIPNNLGYCIKAEKLLAFEEHFERLLKAEKTAKESGDIGSGPETAA